ncbi:Protoporphyrinogen oxidase [Ignavibacterium album JCM 16511]|uniref:Coproporphyrinogen III oxidase n=1 Tax=Ignavibacterium album (strain DSM 19864 / JCM 16511 / NBRC 101810 / Mat9-16) TaxID=945713 RepID=I0AG35_IGNAJ|nr:protoporphyrinogen oxidase [Ignavibacterium album]AFH47942.1 Protoporphyrinogen oxidase [Ignavibacterium album JCM 16511]
MTKTIVVIGAGISGLTTAYLLSKRGFNIRILERKSEVGGSIESIKENGFLFDRGPNSALETTPLISQLVEELNLKDELLYANKAANKRYILRNNELHALPMSPPALIKTKLFSAKAKLRLLTEPFIGRSEDGYYQSLAEFVRRRLGQEFLDYAINPFVAGVYAGKPEELSVKSAFPKLYALEEKFGGLIIGTIRSIRERKKRAEKSKQSARMLSFKSGMISLPKAIANYFADKLILSAEVISVDKTAEGFIVSYRHSGIDEAIVCDAVLSTVPSYVAGNLFSKFDKKFKVHSDEIYYPPVLVYFLAYEKKNIGQTLDGFGFLIPEKENKSFLGALWSSVIFPYRADNNFATFTLFIGGSRYPDFVKEDRNKLLEKVRKEFEQLMKIKSDPVFSAYRFWEKAIPQYNIGYIEHERFFDEFEKQNPGLFISGNFRGGISVGDCIKNAELVANKICVQFTMHNVQ